MQEHSITTHKQILSHHGYYLAHVVNKGATATLDSKPDILCMKGLPYQNAPPSTPIDQLTVQCIKFTYTNGRFSQETMNNKTQKYQPLIDKINFKNGK